MLAGPMAVRARSGYGYKTEPMNEWPARPAAPGPAAPDPERPAGQAKAVMQQMCKVNQIFDLLCFSYLYC